jgi:gamma-glutamyl-gamma-aminobutyrate hydrolase PuuD
MPKMKVDPNQKSLLQFKFYSQTKHRKINERTASKIRAFGPAPTGISYRECGSGKGAFWDHYNLQEHTQAQTVVLKPNEARCSRLHDYLRQVTLQFPSDISNLGPSGSPSRSVGSPSRRQNIPAPSRVENSVNDFGLLFIPGMARDVIESEEYKLRKKFEIEQIRQARLTGRPVLALCGGSWTLWEAYGGAIREVKDHSYRGGMPRLDPKTGRVLYNKQIHRIELQATGNILRGAMGTLSEENQNPTVNSVHWMAVSENHQPAAFDVSALSIEDESLAPNRNVNGVLSLYHPETCIEAFESKHGVPIMGLQWHVEAYGNTNDEKIACAHQIGIINYMAQAGKAYLIKQKMLAQFKTLVADKQDELSWDRHGLRRTKINRKFAWREVRFSIPRKSKNTTRLYKYFEHLTRMKG